MSLARVCEVQFGQEDAFVELEFNSIETMRQFLYNNADKINQVELKEQNGEAVPNLYHATQAVEYIMIWE